MIEKLITYLNSFSFIQELEKYAEIYLVGGIVRDLFLNKENKDIDIIVEGLSYSEITNILKDFGKVDVVGQSFSIIKFTPTGSKEPFDISIPRVDRKISTGHKGFEVVTVGVSIQDDLKRRDFTINSIAINLKSGEILDPFNGLIDIKNKIIRATDIRAFIEDPLRILRGIQFASRFNFEIEPETLNLMKTYSNLIKEISGERILEELYKIILKKGNINVALDYIKTTDIDKYLLGNKLPEIKNELDPISLFYVLSVVGNKNNPELFFKNTLKVDVGMEKNIRVLNKTLISLKDINNIEDRKWIIFNMIQQTPNNINSVLLSDVDKHIISDMKCRSIPMYKSELNISGDDIIAAGISGPKVGKILEQFIRDALMLRFDWKNENDSLKHLAKIIAKN